MDKKAKANLTNEQMRNKFKSNFELVNYAIKLAEKMIETGREARVKSDIQNRAMWILQEISEGKDQLEDLNGVSTKVNSEMLYEEELAQPLIYEDQIEKRKFRTDEE